MATILITGTKGQLGSELKIISENNPEHVFVFSNRETLDLTNSIQIIKFIKDLKPDWIINCAAYTQVDKAESEQGMAMLINATAIKNIVDAIKNSECKLIHISTDAVYDGRLNVPHKETSQLNPLSIYAKSKLEGENYALLHQKTIIIRTSWLYSTFGNNFVKTIIKHASVKESSGVVFDQIGTPTYAKDLADAIMKIILCIENNVIVFKSDIYNYSNEGVCSWFDFAIEIVQEAGLFCKILPILSSEYKSLAPRPTYSVMDKSKIKEHFGLSIPHWRNSLTKYFKL